MSGSSGSESVLPQSGASYTCPNCGTTASTEVLASAEYRCGQCGLEVAHVPTTALGPGHGVVHWLRHPGDVILERYEIERVLGKGGFAATYLVQDLRVSGKRRALKEIPESLYDATETELLSKLSHPSIPDITDQARADGMVYLVLELGGGRTLESERKLAGGKVPLGRVLPWLTQLSAALAYLHSQHPPIIHRDLKPDNVLLDEHGRIMLIDFGIAKQSADSGQTRILARAATHGFSPPEQAMGTGTDPRSDVYALAATAYNLITGVVPTAAHERIAGKELADPMDLVPELPAPMGAALQQALNLNINHRPASVDQFLHLMGLTAAPADGLAATSRTVMVGELGAAVESQATSVRIRSERVTVAPAVPPVPRGRRVGLWAAIGVVIAALAGTGIWYYQIRGTAPVNSGMTAAPSKSEAPIALIPPQEARTSDPVASEPALPATAGPADQPHPVPGTQVAPLAPLSTPTSGPTEDAMVGAGPGGVVPPATAPELPSTSSEATATASTVTSDSLRPSQASMGGTSASSAMDVFDKRRATALAEEPEPVADPPEAPEKVVRKPAKSKQAAAPSGGNSGWSGVYIGGSRRD